MKYSSVFMKLLVFTLLLFMVVIGGCAAPAPTPAPAVSPSPKPVSKAAITLEPASVTLNTDKKLVIKGTGFAPGTSVSVGVPEVTFKTSELWFGVATTGQDGSFQYTENDLTRSLFAAKKAGTFTVIAITAKGEEAKATLTVNAAPAAPAK